MQKENISLAVLITGCEGLDIAMQKLMTSMNNNGFKTICVKVDDFHNVQRLEKTLNQIKSQHLNSKVYGIGIDYGANLLVNYAASNAKTFDAIVSIGNPLNLEES